MTNTIVVTFNFRLDIFGFLKLDDEGLNFFLRIAYLAHFIYHVIKFRIPRKSGFS